MANDVAEPSSISAGPDETEIITTRPHVEGGEEDGEAAESANAAIEDTSQPALGADPPQSKNQQKRLKCRQQWEDDRSARKIRRKDKQKERKERKREKVRNGELPPDALRKPRQQSEQVPITVIIDCQFEEQMTPEELISMGIQLTRCYADHKKARYKTHLAISSFGGKLKERFEGLLQNQHKAWDVNFHSDNFVNVASEAKEWMSGPEGGHMPELSSAEHEDDIEADHEKTSTQANTPGDADNPAGEVVYLTSDSPNTLQTLEPRSTYIIGGIVDKNRHKGICYQRACDRNVKTAKLPIGEYLQLSSRHVLTTNHVHEIMLKWLEYRDWGKAFIAVIPQRKGGTLKTTAQPLWEDIINPGST